MSRVRSATIRPDYKAPLTRTERRTKARLMRQFVKGDGPKGNSAAYRNAPCWCACGRLRAEGKKKCARCVGRAR